LWCCQIGDHAQGDLATSGYINRPAMKVTNLWISFYISWLLGWTIMCTKNMTIFQGRTIFSKKICLKKLKIKRTFNRIFFFEQFIRQQKKTNSDKMIHKTI
jgi:hypothetical protein